jgi:hypothetical protein
VYRVYGYFAGKGKHARSEARRDEAFWWTHHIGDFDSARKTGKRGPARSPVGDRPITATLKARLEAVQAELTKAEALSAGRRFFAFKFPSGYFSIKF